jgi:hypothetical protein
VSRVQDGRGPYRRVGVVKDPVFYKAWAWAHTYCYCCGIRQNRGGPFRDLTTHHIVKPGRSDESCNLLRLCLRCHNLAEMQTIVWNGHTLPTLPLGVCLTLKMARDPVDWNPTRLAQLYLQSLPDMLPVPDVLEQEYRINRPADIAYFYRGQA